VWRSQTTPPAEAGYWTPALGRAPLNHGHLREPALVGVTPGGFWPERQDLKSNRSGSTEPAEGWSYLLVRSTCQTVRLPSSTTKSEPSLPTATPTGLPHTPPSLVRKPVKKS
jgi:hypothetical protein